MKKLIRLTVVIMIMILLTGCKKQVITKCNLKSDQSASGYTMEENSKIYSKENIVSKVVIEEEIVSKNKTILSYFEKQLKEQYKNNNSLYGGYSYKIDNKDGKVISKLTIDYKKMDLKKFVNDNPAMASYVDKNNNLSLDGAKKMYESSGSICDK